MAKTGTALVKGYAWLMAITSSFLRKEKAPYHLPILNIRDWNKAGFNSITNSK
jgi:hypothetical protein